MNPGRLSTLCPVISNSFEWMRGRVGGSYISSYRNYTRPCCVKCKAPFFTVVAGITEIIVGHDRRQLSRPLYSNQTNVHRETRYTGSKGSGKHMEREERKLKCIAALLNRLDTRHWSSTTPHPTPQIRAFTRSQKSERRSF